MNRFEINPLICAACNRWLAVCICWTLLAAVAQGQAKLMSPQKEAALRASFPAVDDPDIAAIFDESTVYTLDEMPVAYQHDMGGAGHNTFHWAGYNISGDAAESRKGHGNGGNGNIEFPWRVPGATDLGPNVREFKFIWLPPKWPVVYFYEGLARGRPIAQIISSGGRRIETQPGQSQYGYRWLFPVGAIVGEVLALEGPDGLFHTFEMRLRIRESEEWGVGIFRPFPEAQDLAKRIKELRPNWSQDGNLRAVIAHLENNNTLTSLRLYDNLHRNPAFDVTAAQDVLPRIDDASLVAELLDSTPFKSALGATWKRQGDVIAYAATTEASWHVVPRGYRATFLGNDRDSCLNCHKHVLTHVDQHDSIRQWYGRIRGSDRIFSFCPFDPSCVARNGGSIPVRVRPEFARAGMVARYDPAKHPTDRYRRLKR